ncbi:MAG: hypothetical protein AB7O24_15030 [Kofleriaceae bacterium]
MPRRHQPVLANDRSQRHGLGDLLQRKLYQVDVNSMACTSTTFAEDLADMNELSIGFSMDGPGATTESLFLASGKYLGASGTMSIAKLDQTTMAATHLGALDGPVALTGTGSGELWAWYHPPSLADLEIEPRIALIDKASGSELKTFDLGELGAGDYVLGAFAFWGGDFWLFSRDDTAETSYVFQVDGATGAIKDTVPSPYYAIMGAGVSTCAPLVIL